MKQTVSNLMGDDLTVKAVETTTNSDNGFSNTIPVLPINFAEYDSANIDVWDEYITIGNEKDRAIKAIKLAKFPYLIESEKGQGKTLLIHTICKENNIALVEEPVGSGTKKYDLIGSKEINKDGTFFNLGILPKAIEVANHFSHACLYCDEGNAQEHEIQKWWNSICDGRKAVVANGKKYKVNSNAKLSIVWTINPAGYAGINSMTEDLRSRFIGSVWDYPTNNELDKAINWDEISYDSVRKPLLTFVQDIHSLKMKGNVEYSLSIRDIAQFCEYYRDMQEYENVLENAILEVILIKYSDAAERELVRIRANDTFGVNL
jgi:MoxR-like ATPase